MAEQNPAYSPAPPRGPQMQDKAWAVIVAGGSGTRMAGECGGMPKQFLKYDGYPLYWHSALAFARCACVCGLVFVFPARYAAREEETIRQLCAADDPGLLWKVTCGGPTRRESAMQGVACVPVSCRKIMIHDAARPFLEPWLIWRVHDALEQGYAAVVPGLPVTDTIKVVSGDETVVETPPRAALCAIQTPQIFYADLLRKAYHACGDFAATDDASLLELMGCKVRVVRGDEKNMKITTPADLRLLRKNNAEPVPCNGFGYDVHRFGPGRPLKLGGVAIPGDWQVVAHSDGDVLLHALCDAILGCASLGDIGSHFPDKDPAFDGISSAILLENTLGMARRENVELCHIDITIVAQKPRLEPWKREIAKNVARLCALPQNCVNIKATTEESLGFTGRVEGIKVYALASALRKRP